MKRTFKADYLGRTINRSYARMDYHTRTTSPNILPNSAFSRAVNFSRLGLARFGRLKRIVAVFTMSVCLICLGDLAKTGCMRLLAQGRPDPKTATIDFHVVDVF